VSCEQVREFAVEVWDPEEARWLCSCERFSTIGGEGGAFAFADAVQLGKRRIVGFKHSDEEEPLDG
jgi:hypothetical protein